GLGGELKGETIPLGEQVLSYTRREPLGVVGAIIPWNAPVLLAALKIGPALCAGNTLVLKAAGVLNVLTGLGEECGAPLANHPMVSKLSFTGSTSSSSSARPPTASCRSRSNSAVKAPQSFSPTQTKIGLSRASFPRCALRGRASPVPRARGYSSTVTSSTIFLMRSGRRSKCS